MKTPPEAFLIFREELKKIQAEKVKLRAQYEDRVRTLTEELDYLKEQISSQQLMMKDAVDYISKLEDELKNMKEEITKTH